MADYVFGDIPGQPVGTLYVNRAASKDAGVHQVTVQGISGNPDVGANSIVVNGGYEDDLDLGDEIIYTGAGGNDTATKKQIADQTFDQVGNAALVVSEENGLPVRVIRGSQGERAYSPTSGFRYDGLYRVESHWYEQGKSGFQVCRFRLLKITEAEAAAFQSNAPSQSAPKRGDIGTPPPGDPSPGREHGVTVRVIRDTAVSNWVKRLYNHTCQICDEVLDLPVGHYAEGAHIRALGKPHDGPDTVDNVLCLCPNHHVLFDKGAIVVDENLMVHDHHGNQIGILTVHPDHPIGSAHLAYHRTASGF